MAFVHQESIFKNTAPPRPFAAPARELPDHVSEAQYVLVKSAQLAPGEYERANVDALEIIALWGSTILFATHLTPARNFTIGEASADALCDFSVPAERLGQGSLRLVELRDGVAHVNVPSQALARVRQGQSAELAPVQASSIALLAGTQAEVAFGDLILRVANVSAGALTPRADLGGDRSALAAFGASFAAMGALVASFAMFMPPLGLTDDEDLDRDRVIMMRDYLSAQAERERENQPESSDPGQPSRENGAPAEAAKGAAGKMGKVGAQPTQKKFGIAGDAPVVQMSRHEMLDMARTFGLVGMLSSINASNTPSNPFGSDIQSGHDSADAIGNMFGDTIGEAAGINGLSFAGTAEGGGGRGVGVGMGGIGTCAGMNCGPGGGFGGDHGRLKPEHKTSVPRMITGNTVVTGHLPPEVIQRVVRQNFGRFRMCYENGLTRNPNLSGRVTARFVIGRDGAVTNVQNGGSDLPDSGVVSCVMQAYYGVSFPSPENGIVTVSYPLMFSAG